MMQKILYDFSILYKRVCPKNIEIEDGGNLVICVTGRGHNKGFTALMTDCLPDLGLVGINQCFPMFLYD